jgi:dTDP-D-glucose 4,6-dehydratase
LANVYDDKLKKKGLIKNLIDAIQNNKIIKINKMNSIKNYIHVFDMCKIIRFILSKNFTRDTINVVHENISNAKMINLFETIFKQSVEFKDLKKSFADDPSIKLNSDFFLKKIKFKFHHTVESTLKKKYEK